VSLLTCGGLWWQSQHQSATLSHTNGDRVSEKQAGTIDPFFVSVKQAAVLLNISPWSCRQLLDAGEIESRYQGRRRLVVVESLKRYAEALPTTRESA
jgi:excisionase family DNA binding protein